MRPPHVLVVDDDEFLLTLLTEHLKTNDYRVTIANSCAKAETVLSSGDPVDVLILDYLMPDRPGTDLLRWMGQTDAPQQPRVIIASGWLDTASVAWNTLLDRMLPASQNLVHGYLNKPYSFDNMDVLIQDILSSRSALPHPTTSQTE